MLIDLGFLLFAGYGVYLGFKKGIIRSLISILSILVGLAIALKASPYVADVLQSGLRLPSIAALLIAVVLVYLVAVWLIRFLGRSLEKGLRKARINIINKLAGAVVLALFFSFCFSIILWFLDEAGLVTDGAKVQALSYDFLTSLPARASAVFDSLRPLFEEFWSRLNEALDGAGSGESSGQ